MIGTSVAARELRVASATAPRYLIAIQTRRPKSSPSDPIKLDLQHTRHTGSSFRDVCLGHSTFTNVHLAHATFDDVALAHATFRDINFAGATFENVNLTDVQISQANLTGMKINGILVTELLELHRSRNG